MKTPANSRSLFVPFAVSLALLVLNVSSAIAQQPSTATPQVDQNGNALPAGEATTERVLVTGSKYSDGRRSRAEPGSDLLA